MSNEECADISKNSLGPRQGQNGTAIFKFCEKIAKFKSSFKLRRTSAVAPSSNTWGEQKGHAGDSAQPSQPLSGILDFGQAGVTPLRKSEASFWQST